MTPGLAAPQELRGVRPGGRQRLRGGYQEIAVGIGAALLAQLDEAADEAGVSRSELIRQALAAFLDRGAGAAEEEVEGAETTGPVLHHRPTQLGRGRWLGRFPPSLSDEEVIADLRDLVPGGVVVLSRTPAGVLAYVDPPDEHDRNIRFGWAPCRWQAVHKPSSEGT